MAQLGFYIDSSNCVGCKACELACKDHKNLPMGVRLRRVREFGGGSWGMKDGFYVPSNVFTYFVAVGCMHCNKPACLENCPANAISKDSQNGVVTINKDKCIGCQTCVNVCPYEAPSFNEKEEKSYKCDMCADKLAEGKNPVCVDACLQRVLECGPIDKLRAKYGQNDTVAPLPAGDATEPSVVIKPHEQAFRFRSGRIRNYTEL